MNLIIHTVFLICFINYCYGASERIYFDNCNKPGFTCVLNTNKRYDITYDCKTLPDVTIYIWHSRTISTADSLTITNCQLLRISFQCNNLNLPLQTLKISNVDNLEIIDHVLSHNPPKIHFEKIRKIKTIPRNAFFQIKYALYRPNCFVPAKDLEEIVFDDVNIDLIETESFKSLTQIKMVKWNKVTIDRIQTNAIQIHTSDDSSILMTNNKINLLEHLAIRLTSKQASIINSTLNYLHGSAVNGTIDYFDMRNNNVSTIEPNGIQILSYNVILNKNNFYYLHSNALGKISPGLLFDSKRNFASIKFKYEFSYNSIQYADVGSINPDYNAYKNVASNITIKYNKFLNCNCKTLGWLADNMEYQYGFANMQNFYGYLLDYNNTNNCVLEKCNLPLSYLQRQMCRARTYNFNNWCNKNHKYLEMLSFSDVSKSNKNFSNLFQNIYIVLLLLYFY